MAVLGNLDLALRKVSPDSPGRPNIEQSVQAARAPRTDAPDAGLFGQGQLHRQAMDLAK